MGYRPKRTIYKLDFSETELAGLEVATRSVTIGEVIEFAEMADAAEGGTDAEAARSLLRRFADVLETWNVEDDKGEPVPATYEGLISQEFPFVMQIVTAWITAMVKAPPPLPGTSSGGGTSEEESTLGLAGASRSRAS